MEAQVVRDSLFHLAAELSNQVEAADPQTERRCRPGGASTSCTRHNDHNKFLSTFDDASVQDCYRRGESVVPVQALALWNNRLAQTMAVKIADRLEARLGSAASDAKFTAEAFQLHPGLAAHRRGGLATCEQALRDPPKCCSEKRAATNPGQRAREILVQSLLNHNDFITIR